MDRRGRQSRRRRRQSSGGRRGQLARARCRCRALALGLAVRRCTFVLLIKQHTPGAARIQRAAVALPLGVALWATKAARRPLSRDTPYGSGKFEALGAAACSALVLGAGLSVGLHSLSCLLPILLLHAPDALLSWLPDAAAAGGAASAATAAAPAAAAPAAVLPGTDAATLVAAAGAVPLPSAAHLPAAELVEAARQLDASEAWGVALSGSQWGAVAAAAGGVLAKEVLYRETHRIGARTAPPPSPPGGHFPERSRGPCPAV